MKPVAILLALAATPAIAQNATTSVSATPGGSQTTVTSGAPGATATTTVTTTPKGTTVKTTVVDPNSKLICQMEETLGTRLGGHKVCKTREQWREEASETRRAVDRVQLGLGSKGN